MDNPFRIPNRKGEGELKRSKKGNLKNEEGRRGCREKRREDGRVGRRDRREGMEDVKKGKQGIKRREAKHESERNFLNSKFRKNNIGTTSNNFICITQKVTEVTCCYLSLWLFWCSQFGCVHGR
jgi:hypothetical protein